MSWIFVAVLTAINIFVFLKLKGASEQMLKMAFPGAKNMNEALANMQQMMQGMSRGGGMGMPGAAGMGAPRTRNMDSQVRAAMEKLQKMNKSPKR